MTRPAPLATAGARRISLDRFAICLLVVAVATVVGGLLWTVAGGGAVARVVFIGGAALATPAGQAFLRVEQVDAQSWLFGAEGVARQIAITSALPLFGGAGVALTALVVVGLP